MNRRTNHDAATFVKLAGLLQPSIGVQAAAQILVRHGIKVETALRVLTTTFHR